LKGFAEGGQRGCKEDMERKHPNTAALLQRARLKVEREVPVLNNNIVSSRNIERGREKPVRRGKK
jgi:hypothetical protein